jgi:hypothetical protein
MEVDVIGKLIELTEVGQLHWISHLNNTWTAKKNDVECKLELITEPKKDPYSKDTIVYSLRIGGFTFGHNIVRLEALLEAIRKESQQTEQKQLEVQITKFFKDNF